jgi:hypothetical protein
MVDLTKHMHRNVDIKFSAHDAFLEQPNYLEARYLKSLSLHMLFLLIAIFDLLFVSDVIRFRNFPSWLNVTIYWYFLTCLHLFLVARISF